MSDPKMMKKAFGICLAVGAGVLAMRSFGWLAAFATIGAFVEFGLADLLENADG